VNGKDGAAQDAPEERRHRRDRHAERPQAEPRLLNFVATSRARNKIKAPDPLGGKDARRRARTQAVRQGGAPLRRQPQNDRRRRRVREGARRLRRRKADDLFASIGYGKIQPKQVLVRLVPPDKLHEKAPEGAVASVVRRVLGTGEEKIKVRGFDDLMVFRARCCNPIRGEKIVGYITRGKGVSVHSATCPERRQLLYDPERHIDVEWDKTDAVARLYRQADHGGGGSKGLLAAVSAKNRRHQHHIKNMEARTEEGAHARIE